MHPAVYKHEEFEFILLTGRTKNQWHTMTRTGKSEELLRGEEEPFLLMNPEDGERLGIEEGEFVELASEHGKVKLRVRFGGIKEGHLFAPFGYGLKHGSIINALTGDKIDPISKEPDLKLTPVAIKVKGAVTHEHVKG